MVEFIKNLLNNNTIIHNNDNNIIDSFQKNFELDINEDILNEYVDKKYFK